MADRILLREMRFYGYHGVHPEERRLGQPFAVDLEVEVDLASAGPQDALTETVSYTALFQEVRAVVEGPPRQLIESVAEEIAQRVLANHPLVQSVTVRVWKLSPPIPTASLGRVGIELTRRRHGSQG